MKSIQLHEIDFSKSYTGYYWYSDENSPKVKRDEKISLDIFTALPFVVEANFISADGTSISVRNVDGTYQAFQININDLPKEQITEQDFLAKESLQVKAIKMIIFWDKDDETSFTEAMHALLPKWKAFTGFIEK